MAPGGERDLVVRGGVSLGMERRASSLYFQLGDDGARPGSPIPPGAGRRGTFYAPHDDLHEAALTLLLHGTEAVASLPLGGDEALEGVRALGDGDAALAGWEDLNANRSPLLTKEAQSQLTSLLEKLGLSPLPPPRPRVFPAAPSAEGRPGGKRQRAESAGG